MKYVILVHINNFLKDINEKKRILKKNMQAALMVPTEILAIQHFNYFSNLFEYTKINIVLLSSKINSKEKESVKKKIENGEAQIIIGTHAIFQKNVNFWSRRFQLDTTLSRITFRKKSHIVFRCKNVIRIDCA